MSLKPDGIYGTCDWASAAQEAAFEGVCFCMLDDGRFINRQAMPDDTPHQNRFAFSADFFEQHIAALIPAPHGSWA
jgi:hypothetical protein